MASRSTQRMARFDALVEQNRTRKAEQRFQFKQQREQAAQNANLERRGRAEEWRGMTAGMKAGEGYHTLADRQAYIVGGKLPEGVAQPQRPSYVAAGVRGQSVPQYESEQHRQKMEGIVAQSPERVAQIEAGAERFTGLTNLIGTGIEQFQNYMSGQQERLAEQKEAESERDFKAAEADKDRAVREREIKAGLKSGLYVMTPGGAMNTQTGSLVPGTLPPQKPTVLGRGEIAVDAKGNQIATGAAYTPRPSPTAEKLQITVDNYFGQNPEKLEDFKQTEAYKAALAAGDANAMQAAMIQFYHTKEALD